MRRELQSARWHIWLACWAIVLFLGAPLLAEDEVRNFAPTPVFPTRENDWVPAGFWVNNQTGQPFEGTYVATVEGLRGVEFSADIWVPARARRGAPLMMHVGEKPAPLEGSGKGGGNLTLAPFKTDSALLSKGGRNLIKADKGFILQTSAAACMIMFADGNDDPVEMGNVMGKLMGGTSTVVTSQKHFNSVVDFPSGGMLGVTHVLLASGSRNVEVRKLEALRGWVIAGGRLLVLESRTDPDLLRLSLGDAWNIERLDSRQVASLPSWRDEKKVAKVGRAMTIDRVLMDENWHSIWSMGEWPLAARRTLGRGEIIAVMVEPAAFMKTMSGVGPGNEDLASSLATAFLGTLPVRMDVALMHGIAQSQIGYRVVSRQMVGVVLGLFCAAVIAGGYMLHRKGLAGMAAAGVCVLAAVAALAVVGLGLKTRGAVPPTVSCLSMASPVEESHALLMEGVGELYEPVKTSATVAPERGVTIWPEGGMQAGTSARLVTKGETFYWSQVALAAGTATKIRMSGVMPVPEVPSFRGVVNEQGFQGKISGGSVGAPQDAVLRVADGYRTIGDAGTVTLPFDGRESQLVYKSEGASSESRQVHLQYMEKLFQKTTGPALLGAGIAPPGVVAFAWADASQGPPPVDLGGLGENVRYEHKMLLALPLILERPAPGTRVSIPSDLLVLDVEGLGMASPPLDIQGRHWVTDLTLDKTFTARFRVPAALLPLEIEKAEAVLRIDAPGWKVEILDEASHQIDTRTSPTSNQVWRVVVPVKHDTNGRVSYRVKVTNPDSSSAAASKVWTVRSVGLRLKGVVGESQTR